MLAPESHRQEPLAVSARVLFGRPVGEELDGKAITLLGDLGQEQLSRGCPSDLPLGALESSHLDCDVEALGRHSRVSEAKLMG